MSHIVDIWQRIDQLADLMQTIIGVSLPVIECKDSVMFKYFDTYAVVHKFFMSDFGRVERYITCNDVDINGSNGLNMFFHTEIYMASYNGTENPMLFVKVSPGFIKYAKLDSITSKTAPSVILISRKQSIPSASETWDSYQKEIIITLPGPIPFETNHNLVRDHQCFETLSLDGDKCTLSIRHAIDENKTRSGNTIKEFTFIFSGPTMDFTNKPSHHEKGHS